MDDDSDPVGPEVALLSRSSSDLTEQVIRRKSSMTRAGTLRAYYLGCVVCMGGFLFGYDSGIIGMTGGIPLFDTC
jgi:hypothetical protein